MTFGTCQKCYVRSVNNFFQTTFEVILVFWAFIWSSKYHHGLSFEILLINHVFIINLGVGYKKFHFHTFCTGRGGDYLINEPNRNEIQIETSAGYCYFEGHLKNAPLRNIKLPNPGFRTCGGNVGPLNSWDPVQNECYRFFEIGPRSVIFCFRLIVDTSCEALAKYKITKSRISRAGQIWPMPLPNIKFPKFKFWPYLYIYIYIYIYIDIHMCV